jgi:predicted aspartyl protease
MSLPWQFASVSLLTLSTSLVAYVGSWNAAAEAGWHPIDPGKVRSREVRLVRHRDGLFHLRVTIDGVQTNAVLDTGATRSIVGRDLMKALLRQGATTVPPARGRSTIQTIGGRVGYTSLPISRLEVEGFELGHVDAASIPGSDTPTVLGQDAIARFGSVTIAGDELVLR